MKGVVRINFDDTNKNIINIDVGKLTIAEAEDMVRCALRKLEKDRITKKWSNVLENPNPNAKVLLIEGFQREINKG